MQSAVIASISEFLCRFPPLEASSDILAHILFGLIVLLIAYITHYAVRRFLIHFIHQFTVKSETQFDDFLIENRVFHKISFIAPVLIVLFGVEIALEQYPDWIAICNKILYSILLIVITRATLGVLNATQRFLQQSEIFKDKPIGSYIQLVKILVIIFAFILLLSYLLGKSPFYFITGLGAFTAILLLVFKDTILGLVASVQMSADDLVRVGDWITMDKFKADGDVIHISLNTVKVQNFDKTITSVPSYAFISNSFTNWRGMQAFGGRRIKRSVYISPASVQFLTSEDLEELNKVQFLSLFLKEKKKEIQEHNQNKQVDENHPVNGRRLTNLGVFRNYLVEYLKQHPRLSNTEGMMVRQLATGMEGIPLEIYCFTNTIIWNEYEGIQSDIFDHIFASAKYFKLEIQEALGSNDLRHLSSVLSGKNF